MPSPFSELPSSILLRNQGAQLAFHQHVCPEGITSTYTPRNVLTLRVACPPLGFTISSKFSKPRHHGGGFVVTNPLGCPLGP